MQSRTIACAALVCALTATCALAQSEESRSDSDPTRPILFSIRPELYRVADSRWLMSVIARYDMAAMRDRRWLGGRRGMLLRFELPVFSAAGGGAAGTRTGLGDAYGQMLLVPWSNGRLAFVAGTGLSMPTATSDPLGSGKWTLAPAVAPVWFIRGRGMTFVKVQNFSSVAGDDARPDFNFLLITPTLITKVGRRSWMLLDSETKTDWRRGGRTGVKSGIQAGWVLPNGIGIWIKPEVWWGPNRGGQWNIKTGIVWYRPATTGG